MLKTQKIREINLANASSGLGIANARRRLELLYPDKYELLIADTDEYYEAKLTWPAYETKMRDH